MVGVEALARIAAGAQRTATGGSVDSGDQWFGIAMGALIFVLVMGSAVAYRWAIRARPQAEAQLDEWAASRGLAAIDVASMGRRVKLPPLAFGRAGERVAGFAGVVGGVQVEAYWMRYLRSGFTPSGWDARTLSVVSARGLEVGVPVEVVAGETPRVRTRDQRWADWLLNPATMSLLSRPECAGLRVTWEGPDVHIAQRGRIVDPAEWDRRVNLAVALVGAQVPGEGMARPPLEPPLPVGATRADMGFREVAGSLIAFAAYVAVMVGLILVWFPLGLVWAALAGAGLLGRYAEVSSLIGYRIWRP